MDFNEVFWQKIRFFLLFSIAACLLFILLTKILFDLSLIESRELLESIDNSEYILAKQKEYSYKVREVHKQIDTLEFDIYQEQKLNEIEQHIYGFQNIYRKKNMNNKYIFGLQCTKFLQMYFDCKEDLSALKRSNKLLEKHLMECKANL